MRIMHEDKPENNDSIISKYIKNSQILLIRTRNDMHYTKMNIKNTTNYLSSCKDWLKELSDKALTNN